MGSLLVFGVTVYVVGIVGGTAYGHRKGSTAFGLLLPLVYGPLGFALVLVVLRNRRGAV